MKNEMKNQAQMMKDYRRGFRDGKNTKPMADNPTRDYALGYADGREFLADVLAKMHKSLAAAAAKRNND